MFHDPRLKRIARVLNAFVSMALLMIPASVIYTLMVHGLTHKVAAEAFPDLYIWQGVAAWQVGAALALGCLAYGAGMWALFQMRRLFILYQMGEVISDAVALTLRRIGLGLMAVAVLPVVVHPLQSLLLTLTNPQGKRSVHIELSFDDIGFLLAGGILLMVGWATRESTRIAKDNAAIV